MELTSYVQLLMGKEGSPLSPGVGSALLLCHSWKLEHTLSKPSVHCALHTFSVSVCLCHTKYFSETGKTFST